MSKRDWFTNSSLVGLYGSFIVLSGFAGDKLSDIAFDGKIDEPDTQFSETVRQNFEKDLKSMVKMRDDIYKTVQQREQAYVSGVSHQDQAGFDTEIDAQEKRLNDLRTRFIQSAYTNTGLAEADFAALAKDYKKTGLSNKIENISNGYSTSLTFNEGDRKRLKTCRIDAAESSITLTPTFENALKVEDCAKMRNIGSGIGSVIFTLLSVFAAMNITAGTGESADRKLGNFYDRKFGAARRKPN